MSKTDIQRAAWEEAAKPRARDRSRYHGAPSAGQDIMRLYEELFAKAESGRKNLSVCVLGATPELRDLALSRGHRLTTVDLSTSILEEMTALLKHRDDERETCVVGNWLDLPMPPGSVDILLGDAIANNIHFDRHDELYRGLKSALKEGGYFLCREVLDVGSNPRRTMYEAIDYVHEERLHLFDLFFELYFYASDGGWDESTHSISLENVEKALEKRFYGKGILTNDEEVFLKEFMHGTITTTFAPIELWKETVERHFSMESIRYASDYRFCTYFPHILFHC